MNKSWDEPKQLWEPINKSWETMYTSQGRKSGKLLATTYNNRIVIDRKQYAQCQIEHADDHSDDDPDVQEHIYVAHILVPCICKGDFGVRSVGPWFGALFPEQRRAYLWAASASWCPRRDVWWGRPTRTRARRPRALDWAAVPVTCQSVGCSAARKYLYGSCLKIKCT